MRGLAAAFLVSFASGWVFSIAGGVARAEPSGAPNSVQQQAAEHQISQLIDQTELQVAEGRVWAPAGDNALETVRQIIALVPEATPIQRLTALLHDAPEYVIGDMISPFKAVMGGSYKDCEHRLQRAIHLRFSLPGETPAGLKKDIKRADQIAAYFEATRLAGFSTAEATEFFGRPRGFSADRLDLAPRPVMWAQSAFMERFAAIDMLRGA